MRLRKLLRKNELLDERLEVLELFKEWQEIDYELKTQEINNCLVLEVSIIETSPQPLRELTYPSPCPIPQNLPNLLMEASILSIGGLSPTWLTLKAFKLF